MNTWIIVPLPGSDYVLFWNDHFTMKQRYLRNKQGKIVRFTTRSGARGVRSRLRRSA